MEKLMHTKVAQVIAAKIESEFNTKVLHFGVEQKGTDQFKQLCFYNTVSEEDNFLYWFLIPIDDHDNIITDDYYEKALALEDYKGSVYGPIGAALQFDFQRILRDLWEIENLIESLGITVQIFFNGSIEGSQVDSTRDENTVKNANLISDLRYRYIRFFSM